MLTIQNKIHCQYEELPALIKKQKEDACFVVSGRFRKCPEELLKEYYAECFDVPQDFTLNENDLSEISDALFILSRISKLSWIFLKLLDFFR